MSRSSQFMPHSQSANSLMFDSDGCWVGQRCLLKHAGADVDLPRLNLLLAIAFRQRIPPANFRQFLSAAENSRRGDQSLANLRLALSGLSRIPRSQDLSERIENVELLLNRGIQPDEIFAALEIEGDQPSLRKFDPAQPRVPAGSGPESGRWTTRRNAGSVSSSVVAIAFSATPILEASFTGLALRAASMFFGGLGFGTAFGLLVVPSPNSVSASGPMPGDSGQTYNYDQPTGVLRVLDAGGQVLAAGVRDRSGVFTDADTGVPFARLLDSSIVFGSAAIAASADVGARSIPRTATQADEDRDEPKLCPDPGPDQPGSGSASDRAKAYQVQISAMINAPRMPLPYGIVPALVDPSTGKLVHYDECEEKSGTMIEAKGPGFDGVLSFPPGAQSVEAQWLAQSYREVHAAGSRDVVWYFAEQHAADHARQLFADEQEGRERIVIRVQPADKL